MHTSCVVLKTFLNGFDLLQEGESVQGLVSSFPDNGRITGFRFNMLNMWD